MKNASIRLLIVGGVAAGASAAARARRLSESARITVIERGPDVSFANCGLPYHIGGEIADRSRLALQTPESLAAMLDIEVMTRTEAIGIDRSRKMLRVRSAASGTEQELPYDKLILAPGASPLRPPLPGIDNPRIHTLRNLQDMDRIKAAAATARSVLVVGAGFIGLEMAEQLAHLGKQVTLVEAAAQILPQMDPEMVAAVEDELRSHGITLVTGDGLSAFSDEAGGISAQLASGRRFDADMVILSIGVRPESALATSANLSQGARGTIAVNQWMQTDDADIYAAGDVVESVDRITGSPMNLPLGGPANRQGRLIADHIFTPQLARPYPGHTGTAIVRVFDYSAGVTGWTQKRLKAAGIPHEVSLVTDYQHASYFPGATPLTVKILWSPADGRLLGAQAYGADGVDKRLDVLATALAGKLTVDDLADLELAYAPPFGSARDVVNTAGFAAQNQRRGLVQTTSELPTDRFLLDVRPAASAAADPIPGALNIPLAELRRRIGEVSATERWATVCALGKSSYFAARILTQAGVDAISLSGGWRVRRPANAHTAANAVIAPAASDGKTATCATPSASPTATCCQQTNGPTHEQTHGQAQQTQSQQHGQALPQDQTLPEAELDCSGLSCPGPLLQVKSRCETLAAGQTLRILASDPGFARDIEAFCRSAGHELLEVQRSKGQVRARLRKAAATGATAGNATATTTAFATAANAANAACCTPGAQAGAGASARRKGATIVVFSGEMDKVMASLVIANGAAALGGDVTLFFTFWGINALRREQAVAVSGKNLLDRMFGWMLPRGLAKLPLSKMNFAGAGRRMMKYQMASKNLPNLPGLLGAARMSGIRIVACTMAMEAMGIRAEELIDGVELGGVADYLESAERAGTNLFV